jgi:hypothetical protein
MSRDISDNQQNPNQFLHNIISNRVSDLSNNPRLQFLSYLISAIDNEFDDNLSVLPLANNFMGGTVGLSNQATINQLLNTTLLQEKDAYKKVLSEKGEEQLKEIIYQKENFDTDQCVISMEDFNDGDTVIQLPCGHIFHPESIKTWLKEESSKCPICRYELKFDEVKKDFPVNRVTSETSTTDASNNTFVSNISSTSTPNVLSRQQSVPNLTPYNRMFNNMDFLYNPVNSINRPRRRNLISQRDLVNRILRVNNYMDEDAQMQNAIMASIYETSNVNTGIDSNLNTGINEIIIENNGDMEETINEDSDEENLLEPMTLNETMLQDIDSDDEIF